MSSRTEKEVTITHKNKLEASETECSETEISLTLDWKNTTKL